MFAGGVAGALLGTGAAALGERSLAEVTVGSELPRANEEGFGGLMRPSDIAPRERAAGGAWGRRPRLCSLGTRPERGAASSRPGSRLNLACMHACGSFQLRRFAG